MPCEIDLVSYTPKADGGERVLTAEGRIVRCEYGGEKIGYIPHWKNCAGQKPAKTETETAAKSDGGNTESGAAAEMPDIPPKKRLYSICGTCGSEAPMVKMQIGTKGSVIDVYDDQKPCEKCGGVYHRYYG